jgi:hypothetical protein
VTFLYVPINIPTNSKATARETASKTQWVDQEATDNIAMLSKK